MKPLSEKIEHIVVLVLENRSFDCLLGNLYPGNVRFDGLRGSESNPLHGGAPVTVWKNNEQDTASMSIPTPDPGESFDDINMQLFGLGGKPGTQAPAMNGFVDNYVRQTDAPPQSYQPNAVMHCYDPRQIPVLSTLAMEFAVIDRWFASAPCQTWPNRFFLHTGTAAGYQNNSPTHFPYLMNTLFNRMEEAGKSWKIYFHDFPQTLTLTHLWKHVDHFRYFEQDFESDARAGLLPAYTFIEPRYFPDLDLPNDQHPPHNVSLGEQLIHKVYRAVRDAPTWDRTLLLITYDEHGGNFDHVAPPPAVPPDSTRPQPFGFDRYGVRVPAVVVSPYVRRGTIWPDAIKGAMPLADPGTPFDHTSIIATVRKCFGLGAALTQRDAVAPDLEAVLALDTPDNGGPAQIAPLAFTVSDAELAAAGAAPMNDFQKAMHEAAAHLPPVGLVGTVENFLAGIESHVQDLLAGNAVQVPNHTSRAEGVRFVKSKTRAFLGR
jgi:phospholipase C